MEERFVGASAVGLSPAPTLGPGGAGPGTAGAGAPRPGSAKAEPPVRPEADALPYRAPPAKAANGSRLFGRRRARPLLAKVRPGQGEAPPGAPEVASDAGTTPV